MLRGRFFPLRTSWYAVQRWNGAESLMAQETIVFTQGGELPPDILALAEQMKPAGFTLHTLPGSATATDIATAMRDGEYLLGFVRFFPDEAYTQAPRIAVAISVAV